MAGWNAALVDARRCGQLPEGFASLLLLHQEKPSCPNQWPCIGSPEGIVSNSMDALISCSTRSYPLKHKEHVGVKMRLERLLYGGNGDIDIEVGKWDGCVWQDDFADGIKAKRKAF